MNRWNEQLFSKIYFYYLFIARKLPRLSDLGWGGFKVYVLGHTYFVINQNI